MQKLRIRFLLVLLFAVGNFTFAQNDSDVSLGEKIDLQNILSTYQMQVKYEGLSDRDSLQVAFKAEVTSVCKNKGCWMKVALPDGEEVMVKFKDYAFFVPKDIESNTVFLNGFAYVEEMPVEELKHYAEDGALSPKEIAAIKEPKKTLMFVADGVIIKK